MISCQKLKWSETVDLLVVLKKPGLARYLVSSKKLLLLFFQIASHICLKEPYNDLELNAVYVHCLFARGYLIFSSDC